MKVLYHHRTSAQDGSAVHIDGLVGALRAQGHDVIVVAPPVAAPRGAACAGFVARVRSRLPRFVHELLEFLYNVPEAVRLAQAVRDHRPDVLYERSNLFTISGALLARRFGLPRIVEVNAPYFIERARHGGLAMQGLAKWTEDYGWRTADAVIPVTQALGRIVAESGVDPVRIRVMSNGIDSQLQQAHRGGTDARRRLGWDDRVILGFTGFVREWNGLESVVELLAAPGNEAMALLVVGDGPVRPQLEDLALRLGVGDRLRFTGRVGRSEVAAWVAAFDVALQPAANPYASPLKLFEYMALGRAIVAPDQPNIREVLQHERNAVLFFPGDAEALGRAIRRLAFDPALRERLGEAARRIVRQRDMTWANNAARVVELAEQLVRAPALDVAAVRRPLSAR
jgi:glycosyltransferase involved in cell wall biosynthesis